MERNQDGSGLCGKGTHRIDLPQTIRQDGIQSIDLLPFQGCHLAEVFSCNGIQGFRIRIQLFLAFCHMYHCQDTEHHPLVPGSQVVQHLLGFFSLKLHIIGNHGGKVIVCILASLPVRYVGLYAQQSILDLTHRFICWYRDDVNRQHQIPAKATQFGDHLVFHIAGVIFHKKDSAVLLAQLEMVVVELHRVRADPVLEAVSLFRKGFHVKRKALRNVCLEKVPEDLEPLFCIQLFPDGGQLGQMGDDIRSHTGEVCPGFIDVLLVDADGQIAFLVNAVVGTGDLGKEHIVILFPVLVQSISFHWNQQGLLKLFLVDLTVVQGNLRRTAGIQCI